MEGRGEGPGGKGWGAATGLEGRGGVQLGTWMEGVGCIQREGAELGVWKAP